MKKVHFLIYHTNSYKKNNCIDNEEMLPHETNYTLDTVTIVAECKIFGFSHHRLLTLCVAYSLQYPGVIN